MAIFAEVTENKCINERYLPARISTPTAVTTNVIHHMTELNSKMAHARPMQQTIRLKVSLRSRFDREGLSAIFGYSLLLDPDFNIMQQSHGFFATAKHLVQQVSFTGQCRGRLDYEQRRMASKLS